MSYSHCFSHSMIRALVDIATKNDRRESPRWHWGTHAALVRRGFIVGSRGAEVVTERGHAWVMAFAYDYVSDLGGKFPKHHARRSRNIVDNWIGAH